ncbi:MAG: hypothetical protein WCX65_11835 [bacterium]
MMKKFRKSLLVLMAGAMSLAVANCGGGGGGGATPAAPTSTSHTYRLSGAFSTVGAPRVADRSVAAPSVSGVRVYAYNAATGALLNATTDLTAANGSFSIVVDLGSATTADVVVEAGAHSSATSLLANIKVAFDGLAADKTGVTANYATTRQADVFILAPDKVLSNIVKADELMFAKDTDYITSITTQLQAQDFMALITPALSCDASDTACISNALSSSLDAPAAATMNATIKNLVSAVGSDYGWSAVQAIYTDAGTAAANTLSNINTTTKINEMTSKLADVIAAWDNSATDANMTAKRLAIKDAALAIKSGDTFVSSDVYGSVSQLRLDLKDKIALAAANAQITSGNMEYIINGYDIVRGILIDMIVEKAAATRDASAASVESLLKDMGQLGVASEGTTSMTGENGVMDGWVTVWATTAFIADLGTALNPFEMNDRTKNDNLMLLEHDLTALSNPTDAQVQAVLETYLAPATAAKAMTMYVNHKECSIAMSGTTVTATGCPEKEEIFQLIESHYDKSLPKLRASEAAFEDVLNCMINSDSTACANMETWYNGSVSVDRIAVGLSISPIQDVYTKIKQGGTVKTQVESALDVAGVKKELFWLVKNLEPYFNN